MSESVGPADVERVDAGQEVDKAATNGPTETVATPRIEEMASDLALPTVSVADHVMNDGTDADADADADGDSEAETLIQSPEKRRAINDNASAAGPVTIVTATAAGSINDPAAITTDSNGRKRKRSIEDVPDETTFSTSSRHSSPLSSPRLDTHSADSDSDVSSNIASLRSQPTRRKRENYTGDSEDAEEKPVKNETRRRRPSDLLPSISKQRTKNNSGGVEPASTERRETRSATYPRHSSHERSPSPPPPHRKEHRRGASTQLTLGDVERKKRGRPPAIHTRRSGSADQRRESVPSDESDSPRRLRPSLTKYSSADHDTMSPAKTTGGAVGPRKFRDRNGRTFLARACNNNDLELAKLKFDERPEELNVADNAGNTPLQIAALEGHTEIVQFLLEKGCEVDTLNIDKETPLIDSVENGHLEVIRLLLEHGANPRLGNAKGEEPYELVKESDENYAEIRRLIAEAKDKPVSRRISVDQTDAPRDNHSSRAASAASPRDSPPILGPKSPPAFGSALGSRRRTGRSESTRNDLLWQANTQENLTRLAAKGDVQGVVNILNVLTKADTESLIAAAKAGHEEVLQYLLGMGQPDSDPEPVRQYKPGFNTPMLAAIGRGHPEVVKLLVEQSGFNPTRKLFKGRTYFEIAAERRGEHWQKEYEILKTAYDKYASGKTRKTTSPRATRDSDKLKSRVLRRSQSPLSTKLRNSSSPTMTHKSLPNKSPQTSHKDADRDLMPAEGSERRKARKEAGDSSVAVSSDQDQTVSAPRQGHAKRRSQSDLPQPPHLDPEAAHRRRRLVSGKEHRRRKSMVVAEESSDVEDSMVAVKTENRSNVALKRTRDSRSPAPASHEEGSTRSYAKKRRTVVESSPEEPRSGPKRGSDHSPPPVRQENAEKPSSENQETKPQTMSMPDKPLEDEAAEKMDLDNDAEAEIDEVPEPGEQSSLLATEQSEPIKVEPVEVGPSEAELEQQKKEEAELQRKEEERKAEEEKRLEEERLAAVKAEEERKAAEEEERRKKAEEEAAQRKKEEEERQDRIKRELEERQRRQEEQIRQQRLEYERRRREALPIVLSCTALMIDNNDPTVRSQAWLSKFLPLFTVKTAQLDSSIATSGQDELWVPNFQVASLLLTKDLNLRNYTSFEKRSVTPAQRQCLWKVSRNMLSFEYEANAINTSIQKAREREEEERPKFFVMEELFWVKLSDFEDQIFRHPHLASLQPLKKQPISLRLIGVQSPTEPTPQPNGLFQPLHKLTNGVSPHHSPVGYSNGYPR
ncbi:hypothetical protein LTR10_023786 [Elasticomyces elasticus]|uniref:Uncharacterized protein n=1 Tax=Exophiala sideris TaxID=1016849 RepID=A0ABR0J849_9EURO|nr:hypothetical protein LTR10_023786 [Elasticomyces elasticus]KAK5025520.1 hypothetical protein LTR13_010359 [Exophiala sideris]KAK5029792.1 hypothetical protein LTS07_005516 [Exophiala sideris]KAK5058446.1 hypothetical protein LTR69_006851 [Exophiala sideris]KAK5178581.1 hypothetical protein LTR44_008952 [Eurotiomycetes sp. CCFEE 6388]